VIKAWASPTTSFSSFATARAATGRLPPYLSPSRVTPKASLKDSLDLAARIFPFLSIIDMANISSFAGKMSYAILYATLEATAMMICLT
jgi:hypothetical protein